MRVFAFAAVVLFIFALFVLYYAVRLGRPEEGRKMMFTVRNLNFEVEIAATPMARAQGLSGRASLEEANGMLFLFDTPGNHSFWMKDMRFPIDIIWIKGDRIVGFTEEVEPEPEKSIFRLTQYSPPEPVDTVLELNAGSVRKYDFHIGDLVAVEVQ